MVPVLWLFLDMERAVGDSRYGKYALIVMVLIMLSDYLDGFFARALNQVSRLGQFLDPIADKATALAVALLLLHYRDLPLWFVVLTLIRDVYAVAGALFLYVRLDLQVRPNVFGKIMIICMGITACVFVIDPNITVFRIPLQELFIWLTTLFILLSAAVFTKSYLRIYREQGLQR